jgi:hypothetical protein
LILVMAVLENFSGWDQSPLSKVKLLKLPEENAPGRMVPMLKQGGKPRRTPGGEAGAALIRWPNTYVEENTLTRTIGILRRELGDSSRDSRIIETVPTRGYRFIAPVETLPQPSSFHSPIASAEVETNASPAPSVPVRLQAPDGHHGILGAIVPGDNNAWMIDDF